MITSLVFSKNRPLQLDLALTSIEKNFPDTDEILVLHSYDGQYEPTLDTLQSEHPNCIFVRQSDSIYADLLRMLGSAKNKYCCMFTDDNIFFRYFSTDVYDQIFGSPNVFCVSLRLGFNIVKRYHAGQCFPDAVNEHQVIGDFIFIPKTRYYYGSYWSYSHSVDGHICKISTLVDMFEEIEYMNQRFKYKQTPNEVESQMQKYWTNSGAFMLAPQHSVVVNSPNNRVSDSHTENFSGERFKYDSAFLLGKYLSGKRVDMSLLDFSNIECPHQEIDLSEGIL